MASANPRQLSAASNRMQLKKERRMFSTSDDSAMTKQVQATHAPDGREIDVKPLIQIVDEILIQIIARSVEGHEHVKHEQDTLETSAALAEFDMLDALAFIINKISCELSCKCSGGGDAHASTMVLLNYLSSYPWHAKVVLTLAAFAVIFGEFWLVAQSSVSNTLAKSVALLKQLPDIVENSVSLRPQFDALNKLVKAALDVTMCIVEFKDLPSEYISEDAPPMSVASAHIPIATYWVIRSIVACASQIASLIGMRNEAISSASEAWELSSLAHKVTSIYEHLKNQLALCYQSIDEKKHIEAFLYLVHLFETVHVDNMKILRALIYAKDDIPPLIDGTTKLRVSLEVLRRKHVLLLISDLDLSLEEIMILDNLYKDARSRGETHYEMVWIPVVDKATWNEVNKQKFEYLQSTMPWHSVRDPFIIEPSVIKYIKEVWNYTKRAILVALDPQGRLSSQNALHMIWIWGNLAFPFTSEKEESLWKQEIWSLELLVDGIDPALLDWMTEGKIICLYGGEDLEWIETFTKTAMNVARTSNFELEMVYVGKSNAKERMQRMITTFNNKKFSYFFPNVTSIWFFWARLESMLYSKLQHGRTVENDKIMSEVMTVLSFDGSDRGWAIFCRGPSEMARAKGDTALTSLRDFDKWKHRIEQDGWVPALNDYIKEIQQPHHCNRLILPGSTGGIPQKVVCAECGRQMEKYFMYRCCVE
ncbi:putative sieve element occlusion [Medicago truncatula]|uniref:Putative sieve element occlusion n=1 Tax=Medicago truncatula TaxID=3880 RepID=A0A072UZM7_MEDTR|nr:protein SIEVE ELEMENT OCCLUSION B [Medicago truncatula]KEH35012.1 sieve element occlusion protein [Medicago truncatula]RHN68689.1 putative sieve element occlusion [Medicago truncatula]